MNKTILKVLKYLGVGLAGAVVGMGTLLGVSMCNQKNLQKADAAYIGPGPNNADYHIYLDLFSFNSDILGSSINDVITNTDFTENEVYLVGDRFTLVFEYIDGDGVSQTYGADAQAWRYLHSEDYIQFYHQSGNAPNVSRKGIRLYQDGECIYFFSSIRSEYTYDIVYADIYLNHYYQGQSQPSDQYFKDDIELFYESIQDALTDNTIIDIDRDYLNQNQFPNLSSLLFYYNLNNGFSDNGNAYLWEAIYNNVVYPIETFDVDHIVFADSSHEIDFYFDHDMFTFDLELGNFEYNLFIRTYNSNLNIKINDALMMDYTSGVYSYWWNFTFNEQFNYNAPTNNTLDSIFVIIDADDYYEDSGLGFNITWFTYSLPWFYCCGQYYDSIYLCFAQANGIYYNDGGVLTLCNRTDLGFYLGMFYNNSLKNPQGLPQLMTEVNYRNLYNEPSSSAALVPQYIERGATWKSADYKKIYFVNRLSIETQTKLSYLNNNTLTYSSGGFTGDAGLENVFALLATAFTSMSSLFNIQIVPGITIGLLLFLPLISGIIILIIWIVKR